MAVWSRYTRLSAPRFCLTDEDERREGLTGSFAMIRLDDHAVVISLRRVVERGVEAWPVEIMAHEVGHHIFCPGDLADHGRMLARMRAALPSKEDAAPFIANLYADLLINDRLVRTHQLRMDSVFAKLAAPTTDRLWLLYMRIYEVLWSLPPMTLTGSAVEETITADAVLGARVVRAFSSSWLSGAGRFAALMFPYLLHDDGEAAKAMLDDWLDTAAMGGDGDPAGLSEIEADEAGGAIHPRDDAAVGLNDETAYDEREAVDADALSQRPNLDGNATHQKRYRGIVEYGELLAGLGLKLSATEVARRYYRERALPHLIRYPTVEVPAAQEDSPEGLVPWDWGAPLAAADWFESVIKSPHVIPGMTTVQRSYGRVPGDTPDMYPINLYIGIDCSGSMPNPQRTLSYPSLAGCIVALSALRAGASVNVVLSGEPGESRGTDGFVRNEREALTMLVDYLGTGYAYGIQRLDETFAPLQKKFAPTHILLITDDDIFSMLDNTHQPTSAGKTARVGWDIAEQALNSAGGGGTMILHRAGSGGPHIKRLRRMGWTVHCITSWEAIVTFAATFARAVWQPGKTRASSGAQP